MTIENKLLNELLFSRFKEGNESAFEYIFKSSYNKIVGFCNQFVHQQDESRNIAQEAFINLWLNRDKIEKVNGINAFLYTYAKTGCLSYLRRKTVEKKYTEGLLGKVEEQISIEALEGFHFQSMELLELQDLINRSIEKLPEKCRIVFTKKRFEGKMNKEISEELDISVKSVEANMTRALKILKQHLSEYLPFFLIQIILQL